MNRFIRGRRQWFIGIINRFGWWWGRKDYWWYERFQESWNISQDYATMVADNEIEEISKEDRRSEDPEDDCCVEK